MPFIIVGDTDKYKGCLIYPVAGDREKAEEILHQILTNPTENDIRVTEGCTNLRVEYEDENNCWWNDPVLVS